MLSPNTVFVEEALKQAGGINDNINMSLILNFLLLTFLSKFYIHEITFWCNV